MWTRPSAYIWNWTKDSDGDD